jgi:hypothetical protein
MFSNIRDYLWVLQAYLRGKLAAPEGLPSQTNGPLVTFRATRGVTYRRQVMLMRLWGTRPMTLDEAIAAHLRNNPGLVPDDWKSNDRVRVGNFDAKGCHVDYWRNDDWGSNSSLFVRP